MVADVLLACAVAGGALLAVPFSAAVVWWVAVQSVPYVVRRTYPRVVLMVVSFGAIGQFAVHLVGSVTLFSYTVAVYSAAKYSTKKWALIATPIFVVVVACAPGVLRGYPLPILVTSSVTNVGIFVVAWALGMNGRRTKNLNELLQAQQEALVAEEKSKLELAKHAEKVRIAREMHDVVAHSLAVVVVQAEGATYAAAHTPTWSQQQHESTMSILRNTVQQAQRDTGQLVDVLRGPHQVDDFLVTHLSDVVRHVETARTSGWSVECVVQGEQGVLDAVPVSVVRAGYRIVGEAITNTLKHTTPGVTIEVLITATRDEVVVVVADNACVVTAFTPGNGVKGMQERAALVGGSLTAKVAPDGRFTVTAVLPMGPSPTP